MLTTLLALVVVLGVLIFVHELGHFLAAKSVDIAVLRFSLGFGPRTPLRVQHGETEYCVSWIPFGGYVKMAGYDEEGAAGALEGPPAGQAVPPERTFDHKSLPARLYVMVAGVAMNALFAVVTYTGLTAWRGVPTDPTTTVGQVLADSLPPGARALAELRPGDRIVRIGRDSVSGWQALEQKLALSDAPVRIEVAGRATPIVLDVPLRDFAARSRIVRALVPWHEPVVGEVVPDYPAAAAGLEPGDRIVRLNGDTVLSWERMVDVVSGSAGRHLAVTVVRRTQAGSRTLTLDVVPKAVRLPGPDSATERPVGRIGIALSLKPQRFGPVGSLVQGLRQTAGAASQVWFTLTHLLTGRLPASELGGPILVGQLSGQAVRLGPYYFFGFMALFSVNLAILNLLPIPVLDGGNILLLLVEAVRRRPVSPVMRQRVATLGLLLLILLMLFATYNDVGRVLRGLF